MYDQPRIQRGRAMSENEQNNTGTDSSDAETTIVNTASVAAKSAEKQTQKKQDDAPLIAEPADAKAAGTPARQPQSRSQQDAQGSQEESAEMPSQQEPQQEPQQQDVRGRFRDIAHNLGNLVGLSDPDDAEDEQAEREHEQRRSASARPVAPSRLEKRSEEGDGADDRDPFASAAGDNGFDAHLTGKHPEFNNAFDIIDQMEGEIEDAKAVLFHSSEARIDRQAMLDHLSELRDVLPVQLERASALMREAEQHLAEAERRSADIVRDAKDHKDQILEAAHHRADVLAGQANVVAIANQKAAAIMRDTNKRAHELTHGADSYVEDVLSKLGEQLSDFSKQTSAGLDVLHRREQEAAQRFDATRQQALHPGAPLASTPAAAAAQAQQPKGVQNNRNDESSQR